MENNIDPTYKHVRNYLTVSIKHHEDKMKENAESMNYIYAEKHKTCREVFVGMRCQMDADFNFNYKEQ